MGVLQHSKTFFPIYSVLVLARKDLFLKSHIIWKAYQNFEFLKMCVLVHFKFELNIKKGFSAPRPLRNLAPNLTIFGSRCLMAYPHVKRNILKKKWSNLVHWKRRGKLSEKICQKCLKNYKILIFSVLSKFFSKNIKKCQNC